MEDQGVADIYVAKTLPSREYLCLPGLLGRDHVFVHVLQLRKVVQNVEEYIVQKGVALDVMVKRWIFWFH